jgi:ketosteroid isomerase-like protein
MRRLSAKVLSAPLTCAWLGAMAALFLCWSTANAAASDPLTALHQYLDAFNKGDVKAMVAVCAPTASILDGLAPHAWQGPTACADWYRDVMAASAHEGAADYSVSVGEPAQLSVTNDRAYAVVPATMSFKLHGKEVTQSGAVLTAAFQQLAGEWRIAAWAWSKGKQQDQ